MLQYVAYISTIRNWQINVQAFYPYMKILMYMEICYFQYDDVQWLRVCLNS